MACSDTAIGMKGVIVAALLAAALVGRPRVAAAAIESSHCDAQGWDVLNPEDLPPEVLNLTLAEFDQRYIPSEDNPDDGLRQVWVPCDQLDVQVEAACQQVDGAVATYQLWVALNCTHQDAVPHSDLAFFAANVTLEADSEAVFLSDVIIELDTSHTAQLCNDTLCAVCDNDPNVCDVCQPDYGLDPATNVCTTLPAAAQPAVAVSDSPAAAGTSIESAKATSKSCPEGQFWTAWDTDGKAICVDCFRPGCNDCAACDPAVFGQSFCWNNQYCIPPPSGGRACLDGYYFKSGGCSLCRLKIRNCAFCNACKPGTAKCISGAQCLQCAPGTQLGPRGYCVSKAFVRRGK